MKPVTCVGSTMSVFVVLGDGIPISLGEAIDGDKIVSLPLRSGVSVPVNELGEEDLAAHEWSLTAPGDHHFDDHGTVVDIHTSCGGNERAESYL